MIPTKALSALGTQQDVEITKSYLVPSHVTGETEQTGQVIIELFFFLVLNKVWHQIVRWISLFGVA